MIDPEDLNEISNRRPELEIARWTGCAVDGEEVDHSLWDWERKYQIKFSAPALPSELADAYAKGMLKKEQLVDGKYYWGLCRNSRCAMWSSSDNCFYYMRFKG
jgi:hypothetical protein